MNQLYKSSSPYLLQHAQNPVEWRIWDATILIDAKRYHKPILVSIGYSTCHWCHVMAHESFEDHLTAEIMNAHFINVKIDREERPDLDHYFMNAVQAMGQQGGWPLHCFLTEEGSPFFGGTYFPPEPKYGRPSWNQVLLSVAQAYQEKHREIFEQATHLKQHLHTLSLMHPSVSELQIQPEKILQQLKASMDVVEGGFGQAPKFPHAMALQLLGQLFFVTGDRTAITHLSLSLRRMGMGGLFDQIAGGFCRYSVDGNWDVPHFEKMAYDHAQICACLAFGFGYTKDPYLKMLADRSFAFFEQHLQGPEGLFYAALDADSEGEEGRFYVWELEELKTLLGGQFEQFAEFFEFLPLDYLHPEKKVLRIKKSRDKPELYHDFEGWAPALETLQHHRDLRILPSIDSKRIVSWNGMIVTAYLDWYRVTQDKSYLEKAKSLLQLLLDRSSDHSGTIVHYMTQSEGIGYGFLEDYAMLMKACLDYYQCTFEQSYYDAAFRLFQQVKDQFTVDGSFLFKMAPDRYEDFNHIQTDWSETNYPSANAILCLCAAYFSEHEDAPEFEGLWMHMAEQVKEAALKFPLAASSWIGILLHSETGWPVLKVPSPEQAHILLEGIVIPWIFIVPDRSGQKICQFCFEGYCSTPLDTKDKLVSLLGKYHIRF